MESSEIDPYIFIQWIFHNYAKIMDKPFQQFQ